MVSLSGMTLQKKISLLVLAGLTVALGLFSFVGIQSLGESTQRILDQRLAVARILANNIDDNVTHVLSHLDGVVTRLNSLPTYEEFFAMVSPLREIFDDSGIAVQNVVLLNGSGIVTQVYYTSPGIIGADWSGLTEIKRALENGQSAVSNQLTEPQTEMQMVLAIAPVKNARGEIRGLFAVLIDVGRSSIHTVSQMVQAGNTGYVEIVDGNGLVIARTEPGVPLKLLEKSDHPGRFTDLIRENKAVVGTCHRCHEADQGLQRRRDILAFAPLSVVPWGVAIRQSEEEALIPTRQLEARLLSLGVILLIGALLLAWFMVQGVVKPLQMLKGAAQKVATGDFSGIVPLKRRDEIGQLSHSFYNMTQELAKSRNELLSRNKELTALNAISVAVSQSLDLKDLSGTALRNVLEVTQTKAGCIFLPDSENNRLDLMIRLGSSGIFDCEKTGQATGNCACYQVLRHRQTIMVSDAIQCPMLAGDDNKEGISFASIPLKSKDKVLGIMNIACSGERYFIQEDFELFNSIGFQVGLALENSLLYSESRQKEELRGHLLSSVINAQEEERKRISRELHDESGQMLTAAIMNIESIESLVLVEESVLKEKLQGVKALIAHIIEDLRRLTHDLRPMALDDLGLVSAIRAYVKNRLEATGIELEFESKGLGAGRRLSPTTETALFRIIQEAITNILKHADATKVSISLSVENDMIKAVVEDNGKGFDTEAVFTAESERQPLGLLGMKERVALLGGTFYIKSRRHHGTRLTVAIPAVYMPSVLSSEKDSVGPKAAR